jgi:protein ImuA
MRRIDFREHKANTRVMFQTRRTPVADILALAPGVGLARGRAHEATGPARVAFALMVGARLEGPVLWLRPGWAVERPMGDGIRDFLDPGRIVFGRAGVAADILWAAEEALRSRAVPLVVAELPEPPELTPVRRLHLAAQAGAAHGPAPLALLLTPAGAGAPGVESRWHLAPAPGWVSGAPRWRLTRALARVAPERSWEVRLGGGRIALHAASDAPLLLAGPLAAG